MKNVLLPTDLTVQSLWPIHNIVKDAGQQKVSIYLVHMLSLPSSINDLLSIKSSKPYSAIPQNFTEACHMLRNKYGKYIENIKLDFVYGNTKRFINNYIEGQRIDAVYMLTNYSYGLPLSQSIDFTPLLLKCKAAMHQLPLHNEAFSEYQILSALLQGNEDYNFPETSKGNKSIFSYS